MPADANTDPDMPTTADEYFALIYYAAFGNLMKYLRGLQDNAGEAILARYPFLERYAEELDRLLAESGNKTFAQWSQGLEGWERLVQPDFPLSHLLRQVHRDQRILIVLAGLIEEDSRMGTVFAHLQAPLLSRRPTVELLGSIIGGKDDAWTLCAPLIEQGWLESMNPDAPRSEWVLRVPGVLWSMLRGDREPDLPPGYRLHGIADRDLGPLIFPEELLGRLRNLPVLLETGQVDTLMLRADGGTNSLGVARTIAGSIGRGVVHVHLEEAGGKPTLRSLGPLCTLAGATPVFEYDLGPGETADPDRLTGYDGPVILLMGKEGGLHSRRVERSLTVNLPPPDRDARRLHWRRAIKDAGIRDLDVIVDRFHLSGGYIEKIAEMASAEASLNESQEIRLSDVRTATRALNRQQLDSLADPLDARGQWDDLITSDGTSLRLDELMRRCRHREQLIDRLGPAFGNGVNRGVRSLFVGPSGTGKTLAAKILASELGVDIYRVDLAAVVNKYIGETEKNLHRVLSRAEALDVILLLDEGDALLGRRSKVQSANDRYANLETNYLLQRIEHYDGIVIVTTNLGDNIDPAFERRMDVVVPFIRPEADERRRILGLHLPDDHCVDEHFIDTISIRCALTGGQLRNAVMHAASLALDADIPLDTDHLESGLRSEYRKAGSAFPLNNGGNGRLRPYAGTAAFGAAFDRARGASQ